jgi:hypothetical protein
VRYMKLGIFLFAACLLNSNAFALALNDPGVVGTIEAGTQNSSVPNEIQWGQYLLDLGASATVTADGNTPLDGATENYETSTTDYSGTLTGGTQVGGGVLDPSGYDYVLAKYNGQNAAMRDNINSRTLLGLTAILTGYLSLPRYC